MAQRTERCGHTYLTGRRTGRVRRWRRGSASVGGASRGEPPTRRPRGRTRRRTSAPRDRVEPRTRRSAAHADELDLDVVLVGPEVGNRCERCGPPEQRGGGGLGLLGGVRPMLDAHELTVEQRVGPAGDVASGDDPPVAPSATHVSSHTTPLSSGSPEPSSSRFPAQRRCRRRRRRRRVESRWDALTQVQVTPWDRCRSASTSPTGSGNTRASGRGSTSITVVSHPNATAVLATSSPMKPAPTTATLAPGFSDSFNNVVQRSPAQQRRPIPATCGATLRLAITRPRRTPGARRHPTPLHRRPHRGLTAATPSRRSKSTPSSTRNQTRSMSHVPARYCFESGGRSYGRCGSSPRRISSPPKPSRRSVSAARRPANPAPTTTIRSSGQALAFAASSNPWASMGHDSVAHLMRTGNLTTPCSASRSPSLTSGSGGAGSASPSPSRRD